MPLGEKARGKPGSRCLWAEARIDYSHQVEFSLLLRRLAQHFSASAFALQHTRRFNATKVIVLAAMNAMLDAVLRRDTRGDDGKGFASPVMLHLAGVSDEDAGRSGSEVEVKGKHAVGAALFRFQVRQCAAPLLTLRWLTLRLRTQCETLEICQQELNVARAGVLDYFEDLAIDESRELFAWERDNYQMKPRQADLAFVQRIGHELCAGAGIQAITGESPTVVTVWIEYEW